MKNIKISIDEQSNLFKKHLDEADNERIIFSAPFGAGKTYFLREFFQNNAADCLTVKLAPVNYSIASNEDIFKLIKFDILFELLAHHGAEQPGKIKIRPDIFYGLKLAEKTIPFFTSIAAFWGTLNKDVKEVTEAVVALEAIRTQISDVANLSPEIEENPAISAFLKQMMESYYKEADDVTVFIENILNQLVTRSTTEGDETQPRTKVLVIDDMDRLDPEHIFRLFNVFSAHFDYNQSTRNKFGFDKVIFVCDIQNIRNIFHSRYGSETDFSGYIDKFFSQEIFYFNNENAIKGYVDKLLDSIRIEKKTEFLSLYFSEHILQGANYREKWIAYWTLFEFIISGALKPRRIYSPHKAWSFPMHTISVPARYGFKEIHINTVPTIVSLQLISSIIGGGEQLLRAAKHAAGQPRSLEYQNLDNVNYTQRLIGSLLIVDYENHKFETNDASYQPKEHIYMHPDGRVIAYSVGLDSGRREIYHIGPIKNQGDINYFDLLPIMIEKLLKNKILK
jgi:hypothetical protein